MWFWLTLALASPASDLAKAKMLVDGRSYPEGFTQLARVLHEPGKLKERTLEGAWSDLALAISGWALSDPDAATRAWLEQGQGLSVPASRRERVVTSLHGLLTELLKRQPTSELALPLLESIHALDPHFASTAVSATLVFNSGREHEGLAAYALAATHAADPVPDAEQLTFRLQVAQVLSTGRYDPDTAWMVDQDIESALKIVDAIELPAALADKRPLVERTRAQLLVDHPEHPRALPTLQALVEAYPDDPPVWLGLVRVQAATDAQAAEATLARALEKHPSDPDLNFERGAQLVNVAAALQAKAMDDPAVQDEVVATLERARPFLEKVLEVRPADEQARKALLQIYYTVGDLEGVQRLK